MPSVSWVRHRGILFVVLHSGDCIRTVGRIYLMIVKLFGKILSTQEQMEKQIQEQGEIWCEPQWIWIVCIYTFGLIYNTIP